MYRSLHKQSLSSIVVLYKARDKWAAIDSLQCWASVLVSVSFMVALWNRADHIYFHAVVCSFFLLTMHVHTVFPRIEAGP